MLVLGSALRAVGTCSSSSLTALTTARDPESCGVKTSEDKVGFGEGRPTRANRRSHIKRRIREIVANLHESERPP